MISSVTQFLKSEDNNITVEIRLDRNVDDKISDHNSFIIYMTSVFFTIKHLCL